MYLHKNLYFVGNFSMSANLHGITNIIIMVLRCLIVFYVLCTEIFFVVILFDVEIPTPNTLFQMLLQVPEACL